MSRMVSYTRERERERLLEAREDVRADQRVSVAARRAHSGRGDRRRRRTRLRLRHRHRQRETQFGLSEVKLGILPAVISPYVISKIGATARARAVPHRRAIRCGARARIGLVHRVVDDDEAARRRRLRDRHAAQDLGPRGRSRVQEADHLCRVARACRCDSVHDRRDRRAARFRRRTGRACRRS